MLHYRELANDLYSIHLQEPRVDLTPQGNVGHFGKDRAVLTKRSRLHLVDKLNGIQVHVIACIRFQDFKVTDRAGLDEGVILFIHL